MHRPLLFIRRLRALAISMALLTGLAAPAFANERPSDTGPSDTVTEDAPPASTPQTMMLVATPALSDPLYGATVLVARPIGGGQFLGFILNKPSKVTVAQAFPKHEPSQKVQAPIFVGGPERANSVFALVNTEQNPGQGSMKLTQDLFLVLAGTTVDKVIENAPDQARFLVGAVLWRPGELESEIKRGAWYVEKPDTDIMMRKETKNLWQDLVQRREARRKAI